MMNEYQMEIIRSLIVCGGFGIVWFLIIKIANKLAYGRRRK